MKCDELFVYCKTTCDPQGLYYSKPEVDEAIAELKEKLHDVDNKWNEQCKEIAELKAKNRVLQSFYDLHGNVDNYIDQLKAKLESVQASAYADSVDAGMRERRLKRALWLARANNAINSYDKWNLFANFESEDKLFTIDEYDETPGVTDFITLRTYAEWCKVWQNVGRKCLNKAEEYK